MNSIAISLFSVMHAMNTSADELLLPTDRAGSKKVTTPVNPRKVTQHKGSISTPEVMAPTTTPVGTQDQIAQPPAAQPTENGEPFIEVDEENNSFGSTQTVLPGGTGSLMNRQLPPRPEVIATTQTQEAMNVSDTEPGELIVLSNNMKEAQGLAKQLGEYGLSAKKRKILKHIGLVITTYRVPDDVDLHQTANNIRQAYPDMWADVNHRYTLQGEKVNLQTAKQLVHWGAVTKQCGKGLRIGMIDTQVNTRHPLLRTQKVKTFSVITHGIKKAKQDHGTIIATMLVGQDRSGVNSGLLPAAELFTVTAFRQRDTDTIDSTAESLINAINWLVSKKVHVINLSFGGPRNLLLEAAIQRTIESGIPVIAAAGNENGTLSTNFPAAQPDVVAVTAIDRDMNLYDKAKQGDYIDFVAPGVNLWFADEQGSNELVSGSSYSTPFVTAAIASIINQYGFKQAYAKLQKRAKDLGEQGKDQRFGWGLIQAPGKCR